MPGVTLKSSNGKVNHFGIEVVKSVIWQGWEPGQEYTKHIVLKNVRVKAQKLKYRSPKTRFFTTLYPEPVFLSAGTSFTLPVTFRPLEKHVYSDEIEFETNEGRFVVQVKATLPTYKIGVPQHINFDMCAAKDYAQLTFEIKNESELETPFQMEVKEPFIVEPAEGILQPFGEATITATFKPKAALVYEAEAVCKYGRNYTHAKITAFEGIGKYPHLLVTSTGKSQGLPQGDNEAVVDFGTVPIGQTVEQWIELKNLSAVKAPFKVEHPTEQNRIDTVFQCRQKHGVVPPMATIRVPITYTPNLLNATSIDYFQVIAIGNISKTVVKCVGSSKGPEVTLSCSSINFGQIDTERVATRTVDIINNSDTEAVFQFQIDCGESVFKFEQVSGSLPAGTKRTIILQFEPVLPINYYRRVACLVHNQDPLFLDLLGTCHTETGKPAVLQSKHIQRYKRHVQRGLSFYPPEQLNTMVQEGKLKVDERGALYDAEKEETSTEVKSDASSMDEYFNDGYHCEITQTPPHVSTDVHEVEYGQCTDLRIIETRVVNVTNHTKGKVTIAWMGNSSHVFSVSPVTTDIAPESSAAFTISFKPDAPNQFYGAELEGYIFYKSMRDYRLVEDTTHTPPWCITLTATGNTFRPHNETFLPRFSLDSQKLVFPAVNTNEATYRTLCLTNSGPTPILFDFEKEDSGIYKVKPNKGLLSRGHQVFVVKAQPREVATYKKTLRLRMNEAAKNTQAVTVLGSAESAEVLLDSQGVMYVKPTCVGTSSQRIYSVKNVSRIPLRFEWKMQHEDAQRLSVTPANGVIQPNECQYHIWTFTPNESRKFVMKPALIVWGQGQQSNSSGGKKRQFLLRVIGEGSTGEIKAEQVYIDYGTVVVGTSATRQIVLTNQSNCSLHYQLLAEQSISGPYSEEETKDDALALELGKSSGILPARSRTIVTATVRPVRRVYYQFAISYQLVTPTGERVNPEMSGPHHLCHILATGVYPTMAVTDARCYGSAIGLSKKQLWTLFSLDNLNVCLDADPSSAEVMYSVNTRHSHRRRPPVYTRAILDMNFSAAPVDSEPCIVQLMVENTGPVQTEWSFLFPSDLQLELDYWAETGDFDSDELHEMKVMDNKLFAVEPKQGKLEPGECKTITLTYNHIMPGTDRLPVLLKLARGREILLNFIGVTVAPDRPYIHFPSNKFMFAPVPVGQKNSPKQVYELYNGGAQPVKYTIDMTPLQMLQEENFDQAVFECLNPKGEVLPGRTLAVEWNFAPLEAKTYMVDVPISIHNGDTALVTFTGVGYDQRALGETMPMNDQLEMNGVPTVQSVAVPGQLAFLSQERVSFGNMPLFSQVRRVVVLTNRSNQTSVSFQWHVTSKDDARFVNITPASGTLQPGQGQLCKLIFSAAGLPSFYDLDLVCEVIDDSKMNSYRSRLQAWEAEKERQKVEFTITENDLDADRRLPDIEGRPKSGELRPIEQTIRDSQEETKYAKYKTLPPIKQTSVDQECGRQRRIQERKEEYWERPLPPDAFLLHLGVTARTHNVADFQSNFPNEYKNFHINRSMSETNIASQEDVAAMTTPVQQTTCVEVEADIVAGALSNIIRGLLDDTNFHEAIEQIRDEPIPYFRQYSQVTPRETTPSQEDLPLTPPPTAEDKEGEEAGSPLVAGDQSEASASARASSPPASPTATDDRPASAAWSERAATGSRAASAAPSVRSAATVSGIILETGAEMVEASPVQSPRSADERSIASEGSHGNGGQSDSQEEQQRFLQRAAIKKSPEFGLTLESILDNTLMNVIQEAFRQEFNITARPRLVAMLPRPATPKSGRSSKKH